ncbi:MAG: Hint domain-containing protein [Cypionkella sp.]
MSSTAAPALAAHALPGHACQVFAAEDIYVTQGANLGDDLTGPDEVCAGDVYALLRQALPLRLVLRQPQAGVQNVAEGSEVGQPDTPVRLEARYALMAPDGDKVELLILRLDTGERLALPLSPVGSGVDYTLLSVEPAPEDLQLADLMCLSFARGTMITLTDGSQRAIEALVPGISVLTRDHGRQAVRWIGQTRLRAVGAFAPVVITAGTLGNSADLIVSQHHRVFLYQRHRSEGQPTSELLVQARDLVDGKAVYLREGGFVDYFSLVFDRHEIIYAEGVPSESLMVNDATVNRLPAEIAADVKARFPGLRQLPHFGTEASREFLAEIGADRLFGGRKA